MNLPQGICVKVNPKLTKPKTFEVTETNNGFKISVHWEAPISPANIEPVATKGKMKAIRFGDGSRCQIDQNIELQRGADGTLQVTEITVQPHFRLVRSNGKVCTPS